MIGKIYPQFGQEKISTNPNNPKFTYYGFDSSEENVEKALKLFFDKFSKLEMNDEKTLNHIKEALRMDYNDSLEYSSYLNELVGKSAFDGNFDYISNYEDILNSITLEDVNSYINEYLDISRAAVTVVHPETDEKTIMSNYENAKNLSFHGKSRTPINMDKVSETVLDNNYKLWTNIKKKNKFTIIYKIMAFAIFHRI